MSLFKNGDLLTYPAYLVSISLDGSDVKFWLAAVASTDQPDAVTDTGSPEVAEYVPATGSGNNALLGSNISGHADAVTPLLSAIEDWADGFDWSPSTYHGTKITLVTGESTTDVTPA